MLTLRDQHYSGKYLIFAESTFNIDYLLPFFDENLFTNPTYSIASIIMATIVCGVGIFALIYIIVGKKKQK